MIKHITLKVSERADLQYMGNPIFIKDKRSCTKSMKPRLEAIQKLKLPKTATDSSAIFAGVLNYLNMFSSNLQNIFKPI